MSKLRWGYVTTNTFHIRFDENQYTITIPGFSNPPIDIIRQVSKSLECNFLEARRKLQQDPVFLTCGACTTRDIARKLNELDISFSITPNFPHSI